MAAAKGPAPSSEGEDRKSTRLNSSHDQISYAVFCLKKKRSILVRGGKETNWDALSKGDRRGYRANRSRRRKAVAVWCSDSGTPDPAHSNSGRMPRLERVTAP